MTKRPTDSLLSRRFEELHGYVSILNKEIAHKMVCIPAALPGFGAQSKAGQVFRRDILVDNPMYIVLMYVDRHEHYPWCHFWILLFGGGVRRMVRCGNGDQGLIKAKDNGTEQTLQCEYYEWDHGTVSVLESRAFILVLRGV